MTRFSRVAKKTLLMGLAGWLLAAPTVIAEEALGRLFFTPERRQQLDQQRELNTLDKPQIMTVPTLTVDGIVARSSGKRTAWINGSPQHENETGNNLTITQRHGDPGRLVVQSGASPNVTARVGDTLNRNTGEANDLLNGGRVLVHSRPMATK